MRSEISGDKSIVGIIPTVKEKTDKNFRVVTSGDSLRSKRRIEKA